MSTDLAFRRLLVVALTLVVVVDAVVVAGSARADSQPPVVTVGSTSDPTGAVTASGTAGSGGQASGCVNGQHSGTSPSSTSPPGAAGVNDGSCTGATSTAGGGNGSQPAANGRTVSSSTGGEHMGGSQGSTASRSSLAVDAANAHGVTITRVKYITAQVRTRKRLLLIVTLRDLQGRLIRDAIVVVRPLPDAKHTIASTHAGFSNAVGQASLAVPIAARMFGTHLQFLIGARTPKAHTVTLGSVRVPGKKPSLS